MYTEINKFLETILWLHLFLSDSLINPFELSVSFMFTITAEYIITFNITHVPVYASYGLLTEVIPGMCVTSPDPIPLQEGLPLLSICGCAGNGSSISPVDVQLPNVVCDK